MRRPLQSSRGGRPLYRGRAGFNSSGSSGRSRPLRASLVVSDLHPDVDEDILFEKFSVKSQVRSVKVCRDAKNGRSKCFGYVNFDKEDHAEKALDIFNGDKLLGLPMHLSFAHRESLLRNAGIGNIIVKNLDRTVEGKVLSDLCSPFGQIISCKVLTNYRGLSKGIGFVQFDSDTAAKAAINELNGVKIGSQKISVGRCVNPKHRIKVRNLPDDFEQESLLNLFEEFGEILSAEVKKDASDGTVGVVYFAKIGSAEFAYDKMNGVEFERGRRLKVSLGVSILDKMAEFEQSFTNCFVSNLPVAINEQQLQTLFENFGPILKCKIVKNEKGQSKQIAFVRFRKHPDALKAVDNLNNFELDGKILSVKRAQRPEEREAMIRSMGAGQRRPGFFRNTFVRPAKTRERGGGGGRWGMLSKAAVARQRSGAAVSSPVLFVKNLPPSITSEQLKHLFGRFGKISLVSVRLEPTQSEGACGFVRFQRNDDAAKAYIELSQFNLQGNVLQVGWAKKIDRMSRIAQHQNKKAVVAKGKVSRFATAATADVSTAASNVKQLEQPEDAAADDKKKLLIAEFLKHTSLLNSLASAGPAFLSNQQRMKPSADPFLTSASEVVPLQSSPPPPWKQQLRADTAGAAAANASGDFDMRKWDDDTLRFLQQLRDKPSSSTSADSQRHQPPHGLRQYGKRATSDGSAGDNDDLDDRAAAEKSGRDARRGRRRSQSPSSRRVSGQWQPRRRASDEYSYSDVSGDEEDEQFAYSDVSVGDELEEEQFVYSSVSGDDDDLSSLGEYLAHDDDEGDSYRTSMDSSRNDGPSCSYREQQRPSIPIDSIDRESIVRSLIGGGGIQSSSMSDADLLMLMLEQFKQRSTSTKVDGSALFDSNRLATDRDYRCGRSDDYNCDKDDRLSNQPIGDRNPPMLTDRYSNVRPLERREQRDESELIGYKLRDIERRYADELSSSRDTDASYHRRCGGDDEAPSTINQRWRQDERVDDRSSLDFANYRHNQIGYEHPSPTTVDRNRSNYDDQSLLFPRKMIEEHRFEGAKDAKYYGQQLLLPGQYRPEQQRCYASPPPQVIDDKSSFNQQRNQRSFIAADDSSSSATRFGNDRPFSLSSSLTNQQQPRQMFEELANQQRRRIFEEEDQSERQRQRYLEFLDQQRHSATVDYQHRYKSVDRFYPQQPPPISADQRRRRFVIGGGESLKPISSNQQLRGRQQLDLDESSSIGKQLMSARFDTDRYQSSAKIDNRPARDEMSDVDYRQNTQKRQKLSRVDLGDIDSRLQQRSFGLAFKGRAPPTAPSSSVAAAASSFESKPQRPANFDNSSSISDQQTSRLFDNRRQEMMQLLSKYKQ